MDLITTVMTAPEVVDRMERLYKSRLYREGIAIGEDGLPVGTENNPYANADGPTELFDIVIVLNYFEAVCHQIAKRHVFQNNVRTVADAMVVGAYETHLARYTQMTCVDQEPHHPNLVSVARKWASNGAQQTKIPDQRGG